MKHPRLAITRALAGALHGLIPIAILPAVLAARAVQAAVPAPAPDLPSGSGSIVTMLLGLLAVLALMAGIAWVYKHSGLAAHVSGNAPAKIVGGVSVGARERVMIIEIADQWIVVGVAPGRVNTLATLPRQEHPAASASASTTPMNFSAWLKQTIDKRHGRP